jgi:phosphate transport system protein
MGTHFERTFEKDLDRIRERLTHMAALGERALRNCVRALQERNRQLAYGVILGDRGIDEMERELDQLCLEFLVRQQPVAGPLRFAYSTIRINLELERIGDYAESIARQILKLLGMNVEIPTARFIEIAGLSIPMLHDAVGAFVTQDAARAKVTMEIEETVDVLRTTINNELYQLRQQEKIPLEALTPLMTIARRFERVSDQAKNICQEVIYCTTGENPRHKGEETFRLLFLDQHDSCRAPMAAAIGNALRRPDFVFESAGLEPKEIDPGMAQFLVNKGVDIGDRKSKGLNHLANLEEYHVVIGLAKDVHKSLAPPPRKTVYLDWAVSNPSEVRGSEAEIAKGYERAYDEISGHIRDLMEAIVGEDL